MSARLKILILTLTLGICFLSGVFSKFNKANWITEAHAQEVGLLRVTITPQEAIDAGAQWRVDGGTWRDSGVSVGIEAGSHTVEFKDIDGWDAPADIPVTVVADEITEATGTYTVIRLRVFITPAGAIDAGAKWNVDGGPWQDSGITVPDLSVGDHVVNYKDVFGWSAPSSETVTIISGQVTETTGTYTQLFGSLKVSITPQSVLNEGAQWKVDDGYWQESGTTISGLTGGEHTVFFMGVFGWTRPSDQTVTVYDSQITNTTGNYAKITTGVTLRVPSDYTTIQAGINAASNGDTVLVADGTYVGLWNKNLDFKGKAIKVGSENGPENCIIDCEGSGRGFYFDNNERQDSLVSGLSITGGTGHPGGAIYCGDLSSPTIINCVISGNIAVEYTQNNDFGGGIYSSHGSLMIIKCIITGNHTDYGGGVYIGKGSPIFTGSLVFGNTANGKDVSAGGGGIYIGAGSSVIADSVVSDNLAKGGYGSVTGGGIYIGNGSAVISNCVVFKNEVTSANGWGRGGGVYVEVECSSVTITNCTISSNSGGGISGATHIANSILWNNSPDQISGTHEIIYTDIMGGYSGEGNIDTDPLFADPENDDYHLKAGSPCIDTGTSDGAPDTDIDGTPRPQGAGFDMGAYEVKAFVYVAHDGLCDENIPCYSTIQEGIDWDGIMFTIKVEQGLFGEHIVLDQFKKVFFQGGWDAEFTDAAGATQINSMTISDGTMVLDDGCLAIGEN